MAGRYSRTYSRKKTSAPPISQFDRLVSEPGKSTHPVASKTAGHVGKWGMTSFTSLRSINGTLGKDDGKRNWPDSPPPGCVEPVSCETVPGNEPPKVVNTFKRRKFFKTRDFNSASVSSPPSSSASISEGVPPEPPDLSQYSAKEEDNLIISKPTNTSSINCSYKKVEDTHAKSSKIDSGTSLKQGGGIKLKIFKSKINDYQTLETYSSTVQLPSDDSRSSSNSSSITNSPISEPTLLEVTKAVPANGVITTEVLSTTTERVNSPSILREVIDENPDSQSLPLNTIYESGFEFGEIDKKFQSQSPLSAVIYNAEDAYCSEESETISNSTSLLSYVLETNDKIQPVESEPTPTPITEPPEILDAVSTSASEENAVLQTCININEKKVKSDYKNSGLIKKNYSSCLEVKKVSTPKEVNLFSTDFDEDEIIDRTSIEYPSSSCPSSFSDTLLSRADTIDLDDLIGSNNIYPKVPTRSESVPCGLTETIPQANNNNNKTSTVSKKRSIFKSRQKEGDTKKRATYKHKWHGHDEKETVPKSATNPLANSGNEDPFEFDSTPILSRVQTWPTAPQIMDNSFEDNSVVTRVKCPREAKKFYTVIKNVKKTHQLQESGEFQEFNDDVDYFLDALRSSNSISTRCLASLNLAQKCMVPAFRMHLRAHATVTKFFRALSDAPTHPHLAECAAIVMFALSQDRLNMDLDKGSLELMLNLLDTDSSVNESSFQISEAVAAEHSSKIKCLCKEMQLKGHAKHLNLDNVTASSLAMETLLSLTSKRAGEWFKEELRELGGVDHLVRTITSCCNFFSSELQSWTPFLLEKLSKIDRCLKVLENVTHQNEVNQEYLLNMNNGQFSTSLMRLFRMCHTEVPLYPEKEQEPIGLGTPNPAASKGLITTLITIIKVLINLTHNSRKEALGSRLLGKEVDVYNITIYCLLMMPLYLNHDTKFEIQVLACCLLLNLVENSLENRERLMKFTSPHAVTCSDEIFEASQNDTVMAALVTLFYTSEESARIQEAQTDRIIDHDLDQETRDEDKKDEDIEETVARLLQKAGRHMEDTLIAAYTALLAGYCLMDNKEFEDEIRCLQPEGHFKTMVAVLKKFLHFMNLTATTSLLRSLQPTERVVKYMERLDRTPEEEEEERKKKEEAAQAMAFEAFGF